MATPINIITSVSNGTKTIAESRTLVVESDRVYSSTIEHGVPKALVDSSFAIATLQVFAAKASVDMTLETGFDTINLVANEPFFWVVGDPPFFTQNAPSISLDNQSGEEGTIEILVGSK